MSVVTIYATKEQLENVNTLNEETLRTLSEKPSPEPDSYFLIRYIVNEDFPQSEEGGKKISIPIHQAADTRYEIRYIEKSKQKLKGEGRKQRRSPRRKPMKSRKRITLKKRRK